VWLRKVELRHVRHLRELSLDLYSSLTLIGGPLGVGKTTFQKAILAAMFGCDKKARDSLVSRFDPHSPPVAILELSRGDSEPIIVLTRRLTDDAGEWKEGPTTIKQKGKALAKIQESLPISADAAALLLWGLQDSMTAVIDSFPSDGHSLLTAATIRGSGPDPKKIIEELDGESRNAKKGGKEPGPLTRADLQVKGLDEELNHAQRAQKKLGDLNKAYDEAKTARDQARQLREDTNNEITRLSNLETLLDTALRAKQQLSELENEQKDWDDLEKDIRTSQQSLRQLEVDFADLQSQYRVVKDKELRDEAKKLADQINAVEEAEKKVNLIQKQLDEIERPNKTDSDEYTRLNGLYNQADAGLKATGVRYRLSVASGSKTVEIREDNEPAKMVELAGDVAHEGVVGSVEIVSEELRVVAGGKGDVAALKRSKEEAESHIATLFARYGVGAEEDFKRLRDEREKLEENLRKAKSEIEKELKGTTLASVKSEHTSNEIARQDNGATPEDLDANRGKRLGTSAVIDINLARKDEAVQNAKRDLQKLERKRPSDSQRSQHESALSTAREKAQQCLSNYKHSDEAKREPSDPVLAEIREALKASRAALTDLLDPQKNPENEVLRLATELKYAGPERPIASIESDLEEAKAMLHREQVLQVGRELLKQRIQTKITELTAEVPIELGNRISQHLASLTRGAYGKLMLTEKLAVTTVGEGGDTPEHWEPNQLSHGERHVTALAIKIAVARSLADLTGPIFVILDDSLVTFDPDHLQSTERLLMELIADGKLQVILLTCHTDWAAGWKKRAGDRLQYIELAKIAKYYRPPVAIALSDHGK
jgi:DNA repair exonuclease SbcCD ATPase subunit